MNGCQKQEKNVHFCLFNNESNFQGRAVVADFGESRFLLNPWEENMTKQPGKKNANSHQN